MSAVFRTYLFLTHIYLWINLLNKAYLLRDAPTGLTFNNCTLCPHCIFVFCIYLKQTAICAAYSINWLVFITEMKNVYSAVRTGSLNKAVCASSLKSTGYVMHHQFNIQQLYALSTLYLCVLYLSQTNGNLCHLQHKLIGFYNRDEKCLQRGTDWVLK